MISPDLLVYVPSIHPRIDYLLDWIIKESWGKSYEVTTSLEDIAGWPGPKMAYSVEDPGVRPWIPVSGQLLFGNNSTSGPDVVHSGHQSWLFPVQHPGVSLPADILSASFWMLSRMEEYQSFAPDGHGRFPATASLSHREGLLMRPLVDEWIAQLASLIAGSYPDFKVVTPSFSHIPTYDIDFAWRYLHKPFLRQLRSLARDLLKEGISTFQAGIESLAGIRPDPYDHYEEWQTDNAVLFFPVSASSYYDRNHSWRHPAYQQLIRTCNEHTRIGIHPGYGAGYDPEQLKEECRRFALITGDLPYRSRMHYLRFHLPDTYRYLVDGGIREDWSMGYADQPGFRAGTSRTFLWYDLSTEQVTPLRIMPFQAMDTTLKSYLHMTPLEATELLRQLACTIRRHGGSLVTLAHANSRSAIDREWAGWQDVFQRPVDDPGQ